MHDAYVGVANVFTKMKLPQWYSEGDVNVKQSMRAFDEP